MNNKNKLIIPITIIGISITLIGLSFAYYIANFNVLNKDNNNTITASSLVETILEIPENSDNTNVYPGYKTVKEYIVKGKGNSKSLSSQASLIVKPNLGEFSKYVYWSLYKSNEEITCNNTLDSSINGSSNKGECTIPSSAKLVLSGNEDTTHINIVVNYNTNDKYYLVTEYMDSNEDQSNLMGKVFNIDVSLEPVEDSIQNKIIGELDTTGKCPTVNDDGSVNVTSAESDNSLLCSAFDAYGTSYYYRGNVVNNYVKFANFYWRIVRVNGDGSIRLIYDGTSAHANGETSEDRIIGNSAFNEQSNDNAYIGYMYGTPVSSTYGETHANINDSTIKKFIDKWYENNIKGTNYEKYLSDNIFCNDRSFSSENTGTGTGTSLTYYRWYNFANNENNNKMMLTCIQKNDTFTLKDTIKGNGTLKYGIGLITADEVVLAGEFNVDSNNCYLETGNVFWTESPSQYRGALPIVRNVYTINGANNFQVVNQARGVKPIINLKPNSLKSGDGTINNPYVVE